MKKIKSRFLLLAIACLMTSFGWAQQRTITGTVTDEGNETLPGVSILVKGTTIGTITDIDGRYSLKIADSSTATLVFSFVGFTNQEITVGNQTAINVQLIADAIGLDEVVAIGYGSMKKSDLTGAVGSVDSKDITRVTPVKAAKAIQGQVAGVSVKKTSSRPGAGYDLNIRGLNSIDYSNAPLVVIDGVMGGDINVLNPTDIESMDILKDASATAIYGSRGANGVVIVTTKRGSKGAPQVTYNGYVGVKTPAHLPDMMNAQEYYQMAKIDKELNGGTARSFTSTEIDMVDSGNSTDWIDEVTNPSLQTNHSISVAGGNDNSNYHFSTGYLNEGGSLLETKYERYNIKGSLDSKLNDIVKVGFNANYSYGKLNLGSNEAIRSAFRARPTGVIMYDDILNPDENQDDNWNGYASWMGINDKQVLNPLVEADPENFQDETLSSTFFGNAYVELTPLKGLTIKSQLSANVYKERFGQYRGTYTKSQKTTRAPKAYYNTENVSNYTLDNIITYKKSTGVHDFTFTGVQSAFQTRTETLESQVQDLPYNSLWYAFGTAETISKLETNLSEKSLLSFMGRFIYGYKDKYMVTLTNRWDGASQLGAENKWDFFPSAAVAWRVSEEEFMQGIEAISSMKMRVSYGLVGNSSVSPYSTQSRLTNTAYDFDGSAAYGFAPSNLADKELSWEKSKEINLGIDVGLFNNRITTSIELYDRNTVDLIYAEQIPNSTGFSSVTTNIGEVANKGIEISLNTVNVKTDRFSWSTNLNFSTNKNEVVSIGSDGIQQDISSGLFVGEALDSHYTYEFDGIWQLDEADEAAVYGQVPGAVRVVDQNNDDKISTGTGEDDRKIIGSEQAKWIGGMTNKFTFDNFDLSFLIYTSQGAIYRNSMLSGTMGDVNGGRYNVLNLNYWTVDNPSNEYYAPGVSNPYRSAIQYQDASFIRISDITVGYNVPSPILKRLGFNSLRMYAQVTNPFVFHDFDGIDPEYNTGLYNDDVSSATYLFGVNVSF
ncbi:MULTISPECIES: SusC/RagA family TonB-linked outer membrane protein [unclassified Saccharicrinis]|uniref:SusC/RagA family TonB-linked outer membrane protein n=1 Tax=unclassified Saccharicrinis TaxID=2646859 RepID=UPI003D33FD7A